MRVLIQLGAYAFEVRVGRVETPTGDDEDYPPTDLESHLQRAAPWPIGFAPNPFPPDDGDEEVEE